MAPPGLFTPWLVQAVLPQSSQCAATLDCSKVLFQLFLTNWDDFWDRTWGEGAQAAVQHLTMVPADLCGRQLAPSWSLPPKKPLHSCHSLPFKDFKWVANTWGKYMPGPGSPPSLTDGASPDASRVRSHGGLLTDFPADTLQSQEAESSPCPHVVTDDAGGQGSEPLVHRAGC